MAGEGSELTGGAVVQEVGSRAVSLSPAVDSSVRADFAVGSSGETRILGEGEVVGGPGEAMTIGEAGVGIREMLEKMDLPRMVEERFLRAVKDLATQPGQSVPDRQARIQEIMDNLIPVMAEVVQGVERAAGYVPYSTLQGRANDYNRRRLDDDMTAFREKNGLLTTDLSSLNIPNGC